MNFSRRTFPVTLTVRRWSDWRPAGWTWDSRPGRSPSWSCIWRSRPRCGARGGTAASQAGPPAPPHTSAWCPPVGGKTWRWWWRLGRTHNCNEQGWPTFLTNVGTLVYIKIALSVQTCYRTGSHCAYMLDWIMHMYIVIRTISSELLRAFWQGWCKACIAV